MNRIARVVIETEKQRVEWMQNRFLNLIFLTMWCCTDIAKSAIKFFATPTR
jgi:hypothetical protein